MQKYFSVNNPKIIYKHVPTTVLSSQTRKIKTNNVEDVRIYIIYIILLKKICLNSKNCNKHLIRNLKNVKIFCISFKIQIQIKMDAYSPEAQESGSVIQAPKLLKALSKDNRNSRNPSELQMHRSVHYHMKSVAVAVWGRCSLNPQWCLAPHLSNLHR